MNRTKIITLLETDTQINDVFVMGWVRTRRDSKKFFIY